MHGQTDYPLTRRAGLSKDNVELLRICWIAQPGRNLIQQQSRVFMEDDLLKIISYASNNPVRQSELREGVETVCANRNFELIFCKSEEEAIRHIQEAEILLSHGFSPALAKAAKKLRWIQRTDAGIEQTLSPELIASDIILTNARGFHATPMAEWTLGILLYITQRFEHIAEWKSSREWRQNKKAITASRFFLKDKRALIIGHGEIGRPVAELLASTGIRCEAVATTKRKTEIPVHAVQTLSHIIPDFDIVVITIPHTRETDQLFNREMLSQMKTGSILVNLARGKIIDQPVLVDALKNGPLGFAALDVFEEEPLPEDSPLFDIPNLIMTPHIAGNFPDYMKCMHELFLDNLQRYLNNEPLRFIVDKSRGY